MAVKKKTAEVENEKPRTGILCPKCKGPYGAVLSVQMRPDGVVALRCLVCDHRWDATEPSAGADDLPENPQR